MKKRDIIIYSIIIVLILSCVSLFIFSLNEHSNNENLSKEINNLKNDKQSLNHNNESITNDFKNNLNDLQKKYDKDMKENKNKIDGLVKENTDLKEQNSQYQAQVKRFRMLLPNTNKNVVKSDKIAYFTFDDGPSVNTSKVLDILDEYSIKATFFVNGNTTDFSKNMYKRIVKDGHSIGNHTFSHEYSTIYSSVNDYIKDTDKLNNFLFDTVGVMPNIIRFPGGSNNHVSWNYSGTGFMPKLVKKMVGDGYQYFDWNVDSTDAEAVTQSSSNIINSVTSQIVGKNKAVILFHDSAYKTTTVQALPIIIKNLIEMGYDFDCLNRDSYAPHFN